ncbi:hypothetical protein DASC09_013220 [Saccharomycopsis crataegensis]|uniref:Peptidase A1 domain-containing protein n=1 Tax=Saccharomycopsis crataegensis TaxID=43959 RepID=A0AAV5QH93_9ASCO|nr:hypothetical protein DASC09_013220 [Saccharomycopsis crataegensis]
MILLFLVHLSLIVKLYAYPIPSRKIKLSDTRSSNGGFAKIGFEVVKREDLSSSTYSSWDTQYFGLQDEKGLYYLVDVKIGTPPQNLKVMLDTGSSDIVIQSVTNPYCQADDQSSSMLTKNLNAGSKSLQKRKNVLNINSATQISSNAVSESSDDDSDVYGIQSKSAVVSQDGSINCFGEGYFAGNLSSTFHLNESTPLSLMYGDGTFCAGHYATDDASIGSIEIINLNFGLVERGTSTIGVMGIGIADLESTNIASKQKYQNLPMQISEQHNLTKLAYSINLSTNQQINANGTILFGAVDRYKYQGSLATIPYKPYQGTSGFYVDIDAIEMFYQGNITSGKPSLNDTLKFRQSSAPTTALIDSGSTLNMFPQAIIELVSTYIPHSSYNSNGYYVDCDVVANENNFFRYTFGKVQIDVPFSQFNVTTGRTSEGCLLGMGTNSGGSATLGDPFFRESYLVFDLQDQQISVAPINRQSNSTMEELLLIG